MLTKDIVHVRMKTALVSLTLPVETSESEYNLKSTFVLELVCQRHIDTYNL